MHVQYASKKCFHFRSVPFLKTERNGTKRNGMVGRVQSTARERSCVWSFHGYACARFREQTSSDMSRYWYALESVHGHSRESWIHGITRERLIARALRYRSVPLVEGTELVTFF